MEVKNTDNGTHSSFVIEKKNRKLTLCHFSHVRHDIPVDDKSTSARVSFKEEPEIRTLRKLHMTRS